MSSTSMEGAAPALRLRATGGPVVTLILALGLCFGFQYAMARMVGVSHADPLGGLFVIHLGLAAVFWAVLAAARHGFALTLGRVGYFLTVALFANVGQLGIELVVARHVSAGQLTLVVSLLPLFVLALARLTGDETLTARKAFGLLLGCAASTAILLPDAIAGAANGVWLALAFVAPVTQAVGLMVMARFWPKGLDSLQVTAGNLAAGAVLLAPAALLSGAGTIDVFSFDAADLAFAGFAATVAGEFLLSAALARRGGAVTVSCADFIGVGAGLMFGFVLFGERPTPWMLAAAVLCVAALRLVAGGRGQSEEACAAA